MGNSAVAVEDLLVELQEKQDQLDTDQSLLQDKIRDADAAYRKHTKLAETLETEQQTLKQQAENEAREIVAGARRTVENLVADIRKKQAAKDSIQNAFSKIETAKKSLRPEQPKKQPDQPKVKVNVGDKVRVKKLNRFGEVIAVKSQGKTPLEILVGNMQMQADYHDVDSVHPKEKNSHLSTSVLDIQYSKANAIADELNLHGMFVKDALDITIKYLDDAVLAGLPSVRILHGKGTGALRKAVQEELRDNPLVSKYQLAPFDQGGEGVTVVTFKE
jgi:DNA mismatch repair protein MutS2